MMRKSSVSRGSGIPVSVLKPRNQNETPGNKMSLSSKAEGSNAKKLQPNKRKRSSVDKINRLSMLQVKTTPKTPNQFTPNQNIRLAPNMAQYSRSSIDTMRSSISTKTGKSVAWPLNDPSFKSAQIDKVMEFLISNNCPYSVNRQMMRSPSRKDFSAIFHFIYQHINPKFTTSLRFEDDIPKILKALKALKYPIQMSKSSFLNVGSPHTWPSVLAMLGYLVDSINFYETLDDSHFIFCKDFEEVMESNELKIRSLSAFYRDGGDDATPYLQDYKELLSKAENIDDAQLEELELLLEEIVKKYESMNSVKEQVCIAEKHYEELRNDKEKILKFNEEMKNHIQAKDKERSHLAKKLETQQEEIDQLIDQIKELEERKDLQSFSTSEINMYKNFRNELAIQVNYLDMEKKTLNEQTWDAEVSISKCRTKISELVIQYTSLCDKLQLPDCQITLSELEPNLQRWKEEILPVIQCEISREKQEAFDINNELMHITQEKGKIEESVHSIEVEKRKLECKVKRLQNENKHIRTEKADEEAKLNAEVEALKDEISGLRMTSAPNVYELEKHFEEKTKEYEKLKEKYQDLLVSSRKKMERTMELTRFLLQERERMAAEFKAKMETVASNALQNAKAILQSIDMTLSE